MNMDGKFISTSDSRKSACGFHVGQRVKLKLGGQTGTIVGFAPAWHDGATIHTKLDNGDGNMGDFHSCGNIWVEKIQ
jgi:hypothetical protein